MSGYPETIEIKIEINNFETKYFIGKKLYENYNKLLLNLNSYLFDFRKSILDHYKSKPLMRFIYGRQFNLIYNTIEGNEKEKISPFLMFLSNNLIKEENIKYICKTKDNNKIEDKINNCEQYLNEILLKNDLTLEKIFEQSLIKEKKKDQKYKGVCIYQDKLNNTLFKIYKYLTENNPVAQTVIICNKETTIEELTAFLYRAILCDFNSCFIMGGVELLESDRQNKLIELIKKLYDEEHEKMKSCLVILYTNKEHNIFKSLESLNNKKSLNVTESDIKSLEIEDSKIKVFLSDHSGVGKSFKIRKAIEKDKKKYIYFPLGGIFNRKNIIERLKKLKIEKNSGLHLDLYDTDEIDLLNEFLFSLLITKIYGQNEDIFYFPTDLEIKIEIPNTFINFLEKFQILNLFHQEKLYLDKLDPLNVPTDLTSNVQVVANYIKALNEGMLDEKDIFFDTINNEALKEGSEETTMDAKILSQEECQSLILKEIGTENPNYYQITTFIDILGVQLKKFSMNNFLTRHLLKYHETLPTHKHLKGNHIRSFIVKSFIKNTKNFTEGAYTTILKSQQKTQEIMFGSYDEEEDIKKGIKFLAETDHKVVSFKEIESLLFFHEGIGESFSIITNEKTSEEERNNLLNLKNFQRSYKEKPIPLPDYTKIKLLDFLKELKDILDIKNHVKDEKKPVEKNINKNQKEKDNMKKKTKKNKVVNDEDEEEEEEESEEDNEQEKENENEERKSMVEISKNYAFTPDNFLKMMLILLRIRANIPVIMMGETGCGKTFLIRKLSELLNNGSNKKMKILNIHAGISDEDIIKFLEKKVINQALKMQEKDMEEKKNYDKNNQIYYPKKLWVFLDEINTCKSMGLISEIMCKHTYQGKTLPSNIVFIAACNPYRYNKTILKKIGLHLNEAYKEKKNLNPNEIKRMIKSVESNLVYTVNPLPHSLLNFVFDFGTLEKDDEISYINKMINNPIEKIYYNKNIKGEYEEDNKIIMENEEKNKENNEDKKEDKKEDKILLGIKNLAKDMIVTAQNFIRNRYGVSSVSLREIRRFNIVYEFFFDYLIKKKNIDYDLPENKQYLDIEEHQFYNDLNKYDLQVYSIILSVFVCYYLRISDTKTRKELEKLLNEILNKFNKKYQNFLSLPNKEQLYIINNIELEKGIAKNRALLDNIFSLFVAINNKIPIFIVGKPGCSKSLSVQLINKSMKGSSSIKLPFKLLPKIILSSFQGSMGSTSEGVEKVFKKARRI